MCLPLDDQCFSFSQLEVISVICGAADREFQYPLCLSEVRDTYVSFDTELNIR